MKRALLIPLLMAVFAVQAAPSVLATLEDAKGDDQGDGRLSYPQRGGYESGDLDLQQLKISRDDQGFWFEAKFQNSIRNPANASGEVGSESLAEFARNGFYQFNLDIYIDTDRIKGSGNTFSLPGRQVRIAADYAWERAVVLTPRPQATRAKLLEVLEQQYPQRSANDIEAGIDQTIFFPTRTRVNGRSISFLVPASFIGPSDGSDWAVTSFVTAAERTAGMKLSFGNGADQKPLEEFTLGVLQPQPGHPRDAVGYGSGNKPSPIVDLLTPSAVQQGAVLTSGADLTGLSWGPHASNDLALSATSQSNAPATPVAPAKASGKTSFLSNPLDYLMGVFSSTSAAPNPSKSVTAAPVQVLLDPQQRSAKPVISPAPVAPSATPPSTSSPAPVIPAVVAAPTSAPTPAVQSPAVVPPATATASADSIAKRLQALQQLFDQRVITEAEYKQQRQRILSEL